MNHSIYIDFDPHGYHYATSAGDEDQWSNDPDAIHVYDKPIEMKHPGRYLCQECERKERKRKSPFGLEPESKECKACDLIDLENEAYDQYIKTNFRKTVQNLYIPNTIKYLALGGWFLDPTQEFLVDVNLSFIPPSVTNLLFCSLELDDFITESLDRLKIPSTIKNLFISVYEGSHYSSGANISKIIDCLMIIPETTRVFVSRGYYFNRHSGVFTEELTEKDNVNNYHTVPFRDNLIYVPKGNLYMGKSCKIQDEYYETDVGNFHISDFFMPKQITHLSIHGEINVRCRGGKINIPDSVTHLFVDEKFLWGTDNPKTAKCLIVVPSYKFYQMQTDNSRIIKHSITHLFIKGNASGKIRQIDISDRTKIYARDILLTRTANVFDWNEGQTKISFIGQDIYIQDSFPTLIDDKTIAKSLILSRINEWLRISSSNGTLHRGAELVLNEDIDVIKSVIATDYLQVQKEERGVLIKVS